MLRSFKGLTPRVAESAYISEAAFVVGDVDIGEGSSVWHGAVVRGDLGEGRIGSGMRIGKNTHIEDNAVVHATSTIGSNVVVGHGAVLEAFKVGDNVLIGNNATLMATSEVGNWCIVAAGAVVLPGTRIPDRSFVVGAPAIIKGEVSEEQLVHLQQTLSLSASLMAEYRQDR